VVSFTPRPLYPRGKSPHYSLDEPRSRSGQHGEEKIIDPTVPLQRISEVILEDQPLQQAITGEFRAAVRHGACIRKVISSNVGPATLTEVSHGFSQPLQANTGINLHQAANTSFQILPNSPHHLMLCSDSIRVYRPTTLQ
jgi:hypothetical protein